MHRKGLFDSVAKLGEFGGNCKEQFICFFVVLFSCSLKQKWNAKQDPEASSGFIQLRKTSFAIS